MEQPGRLKTRGYFGVQLDIDIGCRVAILSKWLASKLCWSIMLRFRMGHAPNRTIDVA